MKRIIVIVLLLILVGGGGAGALIMLGVLPNPFNPQTAAQSAAKAAAAKADAEKKAKEFKPPSEAMTFVVLRDMIIPVLSDSKLERTIYISVRLSVVKAQKDPVETEIVRYENAVLDTFVPYFQEHPTIDLKAIKEKLNALAKKIYGDKVLDVLLVNVFEQKAMTAR
jgi:flagellar basal body-associated protein FliL